VGSVTRPYCFALPERSHINARDPETEEWCDRCNHFADCQEANKNPPRILTLNLKEKYFRMIRMGIKTEEYREASPYWIARVKDLEFDVIEFRMGYPERGDLDRHMWFRYSGHQIKRMDWTNGDFMYGGQTIIIQIGDRLDYPYQAIEQCRDIPAISS